MSLTRLFNRNAKRDIERLAQPMTDRVDRGVVRGSIGLTVVALTVFGFSYSLVGVGMGQIAFPETANGSMITRDGAIVGSRLVAQPFVGDQYFSSRPSAANYDVMALAGSNQARTNPEMRQRVEAARLTVAKREGIQPSQVPGDLITQSGGGIDPDLSPAGVAVQIARVARTRGMSFDAVAKLVAQHTQDKQLGVLGQPRVNVMELNIALDSLSRRTPTP